jgi:CubicO group peptidase (beta-lactamase class C family)
MRFGNPREPLFRLWPIGFLPLLLACTQAAPQEVGVTGDGKLQAVLEEIRAEAKLPALAGMLIVGDEIVEIAATGVRARGDPALATVDDRWHIGSNTKAMTATLAGVFVERGQTEWSTTIEDVFPELRGAIRSEFLDVRLDELLSHTAGVSNNVGETPFWATVWETDAPIMEQRAEWVPQLLSLEPGAARGVFAYSNSGYVVAGAMLERITGESWETLMRREIFQPLGMAGAGFGPPGDPEASADEPRGHQGEGSSATPVYRDNPPALGPAGTVHVSLPEYARFLIAHMKGAQGEDGIVSAATFAKLHTPVPESPYALGWGVVERAWAHGTVLTHNGSNTMWYHTVWVAPARDIAIVVATNIAGEHTPEVVDRAVGAILARFEASEGSGGGL